MRTFYLFEIKDDILKRFKHSYEELYSILESIYLGRNDDVDICYDIFKCIVNPINKNEISNYIKKRNIGHENYICYNYMHSINDYYLDESTKLNIYNSHIKIDTNKNNPSFFKDIKNIKNIFVCDFDNRDYFVLDDVIYSPLH
jgi:hypothetical protein